MCLLFFVAVLMTTIFQALEVESNHKYLVLQSRKGSREKVLEDLFL